MININFINKTNFDFKYKKIYKEITNHTLKLLKIKGKTELSVIIVDKDKMQNISFKYYKKNKESDILSFRQEWKKLKKIIKYNLLGDIIMSYQKIEEQAKEFGHSSKREWNYLFIHGLLHLIGFDHQNNIEEKKMNYLAKKIINYHNILKK